jgi:drug/metabolite transporter (DMT)-like permease
MVETPAPETRRWLGASLALSAAALFGVSTPLAKLLLGEIDPWMLAALLYLGSGLGLGAYRLAGPRAAGRAEAPLTRRDWRWLGAAILAGGVVGPVCLMLGLTQTQAATASLLLNLEGVATALIAWFVFRENFDARIALGMAAIVAGAAVLSWQGTAAMGGLAGPLYVTAACVAWAIDNNLTRKVALSDPVEIAMWKGLIAGAVNLALALGQGAKLPEVGAALAAGLVGLSGYGISIALFVVALRHVGTARTGAYFSTAPFLGAVVAVLWLGDAMTLQLALAGGLMTVGVWLHLTERHAHEHEHAVLDHSHRHSHDAHHRHEHEPGVEPGEPHTHWHHHGPLRHAHPHFPDAHHTHRH